MSGEWAGELVIKEYEALDDAKFAADPAEYATEHSLAGIHNDDTRARIGAWRWLGLWQHRAEIVPLLTAGPAMDFGGLAGPVGYGATVVDFFSETMRAPYDYPGRVKTVFTSHTLEHVPDVMNCLMALVTKVDRPGHLIVFVPSSHKVSLRAENWPHHCHTFCMSGEPYNRPEWLELDTVLRHFGNIKLCTHTEDMNLLAIVELPA